MSQKRDALLSFVGFVLGGVACLLSIIFILSSGPDDAQTLPATLLLGWLSGLAGSALCLTVLVIVSPHNHKASRLAACGLVLCLLAMALGSGFAI